MLVLKPFVPPNARGRLWPFYATDSFPVILRCAFTPRKRLHLPSMVAMNEQRATIIALNVALVALTLTATGARVWRRLFVVRSFELQDGESGDGHSNR